MTLYIVLFVEMLADLPLDLLEILADFVAVDEVCDLLVVVLDSDTISDIKLLFALGIDRVHCAYHFHELLV